MTSASTLITTGTLPFGSRSLAFAKNASSKGGISEVSIPSSVIASTFAQSVSEGFLKLLTLMFQCLSQRDNADGLFLRLSIDHYNHEVFEKTNTNKAVFSILLFSAQGSQHRGIEDLPRIGKIQA